MSGGWTKGSRPHNDAMRAALDEVARAHRNLHSLMTAWNKDLCDREDMLRAAQKRKSRTTVGPKRWEK